jgi:Fanconi anemia group M protein
MKVSNQEFISHPLVKEDLIIRRKYQETIFINCLDKNSLVVIPTGLGKTIVALMLAVHRLTEFKESKIIFLAPTKPLVDQHHSSFLQQTTLEPETLQSITGAISPEERKEIWDSLKIAFMTPQVLQNDIINGSYTLEDVSLLIFDECHRAVGDYAYCFLAQKYTEDSMYPQILGLTASPGSTREKIEEIKKNLYIDHFEIRTEDDSDVKPYVYNIEREWIKIKLPEEFLEIKNILTNKLKKIYKYLKEQELLNSYDVNKVTRKDLLALNKVINRKISRARTDDEKFQLFYAKKLQANAIRLSHMSELIETQGINALKNYIEKNQEKIEKNKANKSLRELFSEADFKRIINLTYKIQAKGIVHPKIHKLEDLLSKQLYEISESRILVFCHFRDSVNNIVDYFKDNELIKAHKFVGQANKGSDKGLSQKEQINLLEEFKEGEYNTLIATSVAEEGLDIAECDMVVFYDVVPSAIRTIQRRGRTGRKKEGKVFILMAEGTRDEGYYWAEKNREKAMKDNLKKMKNTLNDSRQKDLFEFVSQNDEPKKSKKEKENSPSIGDIKTNHDQPHQKMQNVEKIQGAENYTIVADNRETASAVVRILSLMGVNLRLENLEVADYIISNRTGIERKSSKDFSDSIIDGRLFSELKELKNHFERAILILEEDPLKSSNVNENALYGAIGTVILNFGVTIYKTRDAQETAMFLYHLAKKEQTEKDVSINLRFEKAPKDISYLLEFIISGIPGVNSLRAKNLLRDFKTLQNILNADIPDLTKVENIGKKIAQEIYKLSRFEYKED